MAKLITVFGVTGNQGGSVVKAILDHPKLSKEYSVRGITRDTSKPAAAALKDKGVEVVSADLNDEESLRKAVEGSSVVFGVTNFWEKMDGDHETNQGIALAKAAKAANVERFIFSSLPYVSKATNGKLTIVKHYDSKAKVEEWARENGVPGTYYMPAMFMPDFAKQFRKDDQGNYALTTPWKETTKFPLIDIVSDSGKFVAAILLNLDKTLNKRIIASSPYITVEQALKDYESASGHKVALNRVSYEQFKSFLPPQIRDELAGNIGLIEDPGYYVGEPENALEESIQLVKDSGLDAPVTWKEYVAKHIKD